MSNQQIDKLPLLTLWFLDQQIVYLTVPLDVRKRVLENSQSASDHQTQFLKINSDIVYCFVFSTNFVRMKQSIQGFKSSVKLASS